MEDAAPALLRLRPVAPSTPYARFVAHRQSMLSAFAEWVTDTEDRPRPADVAHEVAATGNAVGLALAVMANPAVSS